MKPTRKLIRRSKRVVKEQGELVRQREILEAMIKEMNRALVSDYRRNHWQGWHG
jgi:hypothetical protein